MIPRHSSLSESKVSSPRISETAFAEELMPEFSCKPLNPAILAVLGFSWVGVPLGQNHQTLKAAQELIKNGWIQSGLGVVCSQNRLKPTLDPLWGHVWPKTSMPNRSLVILALNDSGLTTILQNRLGAGLLMRNERR